MRWISTAGSVLMLLLIAGCGGVPNKPEAQYQAGLRAENEKEFQQAIRFYQKTIELDPGHREAQMKLGHFHMQEGDPKLALRHYRKLYEEYATSDTESPDKYLHEARAEAHREAGQFIKALEYYSRALAKDEQDFENLLARARIFFRIQEYDRARRDFRAVLDQKNRLEAYIGLAKVHLQRNDWKKAIKVLNKAIELEPEQSRLYLYRAKAYREQNEAKKMKDDFRKYLSLENPKASEFDIEKKLDSLPELEQ